MPSSKGSKRNILAGTGPLTPPASDDEAEADRLQQRRLASIGESTGTSAPSEGAGSLLLGERGVQPLKASYGDGDGRKENELLPLERASSDEKKDEYMYTAASASGSSDLIANTSTSISCPISRKQGGQNSATARRPSAGSLSVASAAESECNSITQEFFGPALAAFGNGQQQQHQPQSRAAPPPPRRQARPGLLVKQKTARNVQNAKTTSFVQTAGMRRARERHLQSQKEGSSGGGGQRSRGESGGSYRAMMHANGNRMRRASGTSTLSGSGQRNFGSSLNLSALAGGDGNDYVDIDLCDECLHCPSLTALRQSFHESLMYGDGHACSQAEDETGR